MQMSKLSVHILLFLGSVLIASVSQILLKLSAGKTYPNRLREYLNPFVMLAYLLFFGCTLVSVFALRVVPLSLAPVLEASGYVFVAILSRAVLGERITKKKALGLSVILAGILICTL